MARRRQKQDLGRTPPSPHLRPQHHSGAPMRPVIANAPAGFRKFLRASGCVGEGKGGKLGGTVRETAAIQHEGNPGRPLDPITQAINLMHLQRAER